MSRGIIYLNGGGGADRSGSPVVETLAPAVTPDGYRYITSPVMDVSYERARKPACRVLTDAAILLMDPAGLIELYYGLLAWESRKGTCGVLHSHPRYCIDNEFAAAFSWEKQYPTGKEIFVEMWEGRLRNRIFELRTDLRTIRTESGEEIPGLVDLTGIRLRPECQLSTTAEIFKWVMAAVGAILSPFNLAILIVEVASAATRIAAQIRKAKAQAEIINRIRQGAFGLIEDRNRDILIEAGLLQDTLEYEQAIQEETNETAWQLAWAMGLPHPAMCQFKTPPRTTGIIPYDIPADTYGIWGGQHFQVVMLRHWMRKLYLLFHAKLHLGLEEAIANYPDWIEITSDAWPTVASDVLDYPIGKYQGTIPVVAEKDGRYFVRTVPMTGRPARWIDIDQDIALTAVRNWLNVRLNKEAIDPAKADMVRRVMISWLPDDPARIIVYPPGHVGETHATELPFLAAGVTNPVTGLTARSITTDLPDPATVTAAAATEAAAVAARQAAALGIQPSSLTDASGQPATSNPQPTQAWLWLALAVIGLWLFGKKK